MVSKVDAGDQVMQKAKSSTVIFDPFYSRLFPPPHQKKLYHISKFQLINKTHPTYHLTAMTEAAYEF